MLPTLFTIPLPWGGALPIKGYGLMLMIGFLTGIWSSMRRAQKVRSDPDVVLNAGFLCLIGGVIGGRLFYVMHYWDTHFKGRGLLAAIDVTSGGLEFYGGMVAGITAIILYLLIKGHSVRLFLDTMAPGLMWGLACGRMGCFLNGCCFGGTCPAYIPWPLAITFPYASLAHGHHFQENRAALPRELMYVDPFGLVARPIDRDHIAMKPEEIYGPKEDYRQAGEALGAALDKLSPSQDAENTRKAWLRFTVERRSMPRGVQARLNAEEARQDSARIAAVWRDLVDACAAIPEGQQLLELLKAEHSAWLAWQEHAMSLRDLLGDSRNPRPKPSDIQKLQELARDFRSHPVFAAQLLGFGNGVILSGMLSLLFYRRRVHGAVAGWMFVLYPITRVILEFIRADNPIDSGGMTISQAISLGLVPLALVYLVVIYKFLPPQSPRARIWTPPSKDPPPPSKDVSGPAGDQAPAVVSGGTSGGNDDRASKKQKSRAKTKAKQRGPVVETVVVTPDAIGPTEQAWSETEAVCAKCGVILRPPEGLIYQQRLSKRSGQPRAARVPEIASADPNTVMELICEACFDRRPPQDKARAKRLAKKWWKTSKV